MKKVITFRRFKKYCFLVDIFDYCDGNEKADIKCTAKNCPVFKKLKEAK